MSLEIFVRRGKYFNTLLAFTSQVKYLTVRSLKEFKQKRKDSKHLCFKDWWIWRFARNRQTTFQNLFNLFNKHI